MAAGARKAVGDRRQRGLAPTGPRRDKRMPRYVELKTGYSDNGPAWIGRVRLSRSGRTVYFNAKALKRSHSEGAGSHYDLETGESYWVSEVKKNGEDRHRWVPVKLLSRRP